MVKLLARGAEACIFLDGKTVVKERVKKNYRLDDIDNRLRKSRTRKESRLLKKAGDVAPKIISVNDKEMKIVMELLDGEVLRDVFDSFPKDRLLQISRGIGGLISGLHDKDVIHGDLTTNNMIIQGGVKDFRIHFIDFGLGFISQRIEDKAVDLYLFKQILESYHVYPEESFKNVLEGYKNSKDFVEILDKLRKVESRGRYKDKVI